jgi:hypothetical protein
MPERRFPSPTGSLLCGARLLLGGHAFHGAQEARVAAIGIIGDWLQTEARFLVLWSRGTTP